MGRKLPPCLASGACRRGLGEPSRSERGSVCCSVTCLRPWLHPRSRTCLTALQLLSLGRASLQRDGSTVLVAPSQSLLCTPLWVTGVKFCSRALMTVPQQPSRSPVEAPARAARGPFVASCRVLLISFLSKCDARQSWAPAGLLYPHPVYNLLRKPSPLPRC